MAPNHRHIVVKVVLTDKGDLMEYVKAQLVDVQLQVIYKKVY